MIEISGLEKRFAGIPVFSGIDLAIETGEIVVIIGPSGTGKSTFLRCLNALEIADRGAIAIGALSVTPKTAKKAELVALRRKTGFVFQNYALFAHLTARDNIAEALVTVRKMHRKEARSRADAILADIGLGDRGGQYPASLSGGQQQRVGIGRAMALAPELLLFDEPTSALDPEWVGEVLLLMKKLASRNQTMLIATHEMQFAREVADRVVFMTDGGIVEEGPPDAIFGHPKDPRLARFLRQLASAKPCCGPECPRRQHLLDPT